MSIDDGLEQLVRVDPVWVKSLEPVHPHFAQGITLACAGICGPGRAMKEAGWPSTPKNAIDFEKAVTPALQALYCKHAPQKRDVAKMQPSDWEDSEGVVAGFPCQPHSLIGKIYGLKDKRGKALMKFLEAVNT